MWMTASFFTIQDKITKVDFVIGRIMWQTHGLYFIFLKCVYGFNKMANYPLQDVFYRLGSSSVL